MRLAVGYFRVMIGTEADRVAPAGVPEGPQWDHNGPPMCAAPDGQEQHIGPPMCAATEGAQGGHIGAPMCGAPSPPEQKGASPAESAPASPKDTGATES